MTKSIFAYSAIYGEHDKLPEELQKIEKYKSSITIYTDFNRFWILNHPFAPSDSRIKSGLSEYANNNYRAKFWRLHPESSELTCYNPNINSLFESGIGIIKISDISLWLDGSIEVTHKGFPESLINLIGDYDIIIMRHPERTCIYDESIFALSRQKYHNEPVIEQVSYYKSQGHPNNYGLFETGLLLRKNNEIMKEFNAAWWKEINNWSIQDQLSFPFVLRNFINNRGLKVKIIEPIHRNHKYFRIHPHIKKYHITEL